MNQALPKWVSVAALFVLTALGLLLAINHDRIHVYQTFLRETSPHVSTNFSALSIDMDEDTVRQHFAGVPFFCEANGPGNDGLGDRACYAAIDRADGDAALTLALFFRQGKLAHAVVQMPWWVHQSWMDRLVQKYGVPTHAGRVSRFGGPVLRWSVPNGYLEFNRDRSFNPLEWNVVMWTGRPMQ